MCADHLTFDELGHCNVMYPSQQRFERFAVLVEAVKFKALSLKKSLTNPSTYHTVENGLMSSELYGFSALHVGTLARSPFKIHSLNRQHILNMSFTKPFPSNSGQWVEIVRRLHQQVDFPDRWRLPDLPGASDTSLSVSQQAKLLEALCEFNVLIWPGYDSSDSAAFHFMRALKLLDGSFALQVGDSLCCKHPILGGTFSMQHLNAHLQKKIGYIDNVCNWDLLSGIGKSRVLPVLAIHAKPPAEMSDSNKTADIPNLPNVVLLFEDDIKWFYAGLYNLCTVFYI